MNDCLMDLFFIFRVFWKCGMKVIWKKQAVLKYCWKWSKGREDAIALYRYVRVILNKMSVFEFLNIYQKIYKYFKAKGIKSERLRHSFAFFYSSWSDLSKSQKRYIFLKKYMIYYLYKGGQTNGYFWNNSCTSTGIVQY